jgi:hypothetical protein
MRPAQTAPTEALLLPLSLANTQIIPQIRARIPNYPEGHNQESHAGVSKNSTASTNLVKTLKTIYL